MFNAGIDRESMQNGYKKNGSSKTGVIRKKNASVFPFPDMTKDVKRTFHAIGYYWNIKALCRTDKQPVQGIHGCALML